MFGELGLFNGDGACSDPNFFNAANKKIDEQEMADGWYAYLRGVYELSRIYGVDIGINVWGFPLGDLWPNDTPGNYFLNIGLRQSESPAYRVIKAIIGPDD